LRRFIFLSGYSEPLNDHLPDQCRVRRAAGDKGIDPDELV
jgi:hypothetical protein